MKKHPHRIIASPLAGKVAVCLIVFTILLAWGWHTEHDHRRQHNPPAIEHIAEDHPSQDVAILRAYELDQAHIFLPRQYVKILRHRTEVGADEDMIPSK